ncbi:hypothetical protein Patl1_15919 [Pistacia atlantica]|uniref:Uncharacterized protein n=1 Tax=Pistacia atlantica TaxID=434234 RepID=A0ACC1B7K7_9ROSI|nr:hypothetical protein Patl1_15919 [Pistacia atlantica]
MCFLLFIYSISCVNIIHSYCHKAAQSSPTVNSKFCVIALEANPKKLVDISIELTISSATNISTRIAQLLDDGRLDYDALQDWFRLYSDAKSALQEAIDHIKQKDYQSTNLKVSSVVAASTTCEDGFKEKKGFPFRYGEQTILSIKCN